MKQVTRSQCVGAIVGTAIGDALGAPFETMFVSDIAEHYPDFNVKTADYVRAKSGRRKDTDSAQPCAGQWRSNWWNKGDFRKWMVRGSAIRNREHLQDLRRKLPRRGSSSEHFEGCADHCQ